MQKIILLLLLMGLSACSLPPAKKGSIYQDNYQHLSEYADWVIEKAMSQDNMGSVSLVVMDNQQMVYGKSFGMANRAQSLPASLDTPYPIGSLSGLFTGTAIMQLHEKGELDIDKPLIDYLPEFSVKSDFDVREITLRRMLSDYSGLPFIGNGTDQTLDELQPLLAESYTTFPPDIIRKHSAIAYALLAEVVQRVSAMDYEDYVQQFILQPLGMHSAYFGVREPFIQSYFDKRTIPYKPLGLKHVADLVMSANDLAKFARYWLEDETSTGILQASTKQEMWSQQNSLAFIDSDYPMGLSWELTPIFADLAGLTHVSHHFNQIVGFESRLLVDRQRKLAIVLLTSSPIENYYLGTLDKDLLLKAIETKRGYVYRPKVGTLQAGVFSEGQKKKFSGIYVSPVLGEISIAENEGDLYSTILGSTRKMTPILGGAFLFNMPLIDRPVKWVEYQDDELLLMEDKPSPIAQKLKPGVMRLSWHRRLGKYRLKTANKELSKAIRGIILSEFKGYLKLEFQFEKRTGPGYSLFTILSENRAKNIQYTSGASLVFDNDKQFRHLGLTYERVE